ncbi:MAG: methyltransferase [bacterium]|nr:methyltransferase [bacterium]
MIREIGAIGYDDKILEPSAGLGHIADRLIKKTFLTPNKIDVIEPIEEMRGILKLKGYNLVDYDILHYNPQKQYDKIIMNPPFDNGSDILHFVHCYNLLKKGGKLVSILPENDFLPLRQDGYEKWVQDWLGNGEKKEINEYLLDILQNNKSKVVKLGKVFDKSDVPDDIETRLVVISKSI